MGMNANVGILRRGGTLKRFIVSRDQTLNEDHT
jgi:hypothetical protein